MGPRNKLASLAIFKKKGFYPRISLARPGSCNPRGAVIQEVLYPRNKLASLALFKKKGSTLESPLPGQGAVTLEELQPNRCCNPETSSLRSHFLNKRLLP